jgi:hypothetical protein
MAVRQPRYGKEEHARRGTEMYEQRVKDLVKTHGDGKIVAIDVDTGEFEVADDTHAAATRLLTRLPDAQIWCVRIGHIAVRRYGVRSGSVTP